MHSIYDMLSSSGLFQEQHPLYQTPHPLFQQPEKSSQSRLLTSPTSYEKWLADHFAKVVSAPLAEHHHRFWKRVDAIELGQPFRSFAEFWPRGGGKSTTLELAIAFLGFNLKRKYVLYVSGTQDQADKHVQAISTFLASCGIERSLNQYGHSKGWRRNQLRSSNGFNVESLGLDVAVRGIKLDEVRPDFIMFDDVDNHTDTPRTITKKIDAITQSIIPAGSVDCGFGFMQNLIHEESIASKLLEGTADFLLDADVSMPVVAIENLEYRRAETTGGRKVYMIVGGEPTWEGQTILDCERKINNSGLAAFLRESQHEVRSTAGYFFDETQFGEFEELPQGVEWRFCRAWDLAATEGGGDFTVGTLLGYNGFGVYVLDVKRCQYNSAKVRALIKQTKEQDDRGEIWEGQEFNTNGETVKKGSCVFQFKGRVKTKIPQDPGQAGKDQAEQFKKLLPGVEVHPVTGSKSTRATGWADCVNLGNVRLRKGCDWIAPYVKVHRLFREDETHEFDDDVDSSADAYNELCPKSENSLGSALTLMMP